MQFRKFVTTALVAGAGLALSASAFAQSSSSTFTSSDDGIDSSVEVTIHASTTQFTHTFTSGGAAAIAIATPIGVGGAGVSIPEFSFIDSSSSTNSGAGTTSNSTTSLGTDGNGRTSTTAFNRDSIFVHVEASDSAGSSGVTATHSTGPSLAALFVFGQTLTVEDGAHLTDRTGQAFTANGTGFIAAGVAGSLALNQVAGIGNQQGNNLSTALEIDSGANSVSAVGSQTLADNGIIHELFKADGDLAELGTASGTVATFGNISGAVAVNQAAGTGNQQVNNISLAH